MHKANNAYTLENNTIIIQRELTELDLFVKKFIDILRKHSDYLIVSGYVSICSGRTRGTEDIDVIVPLMDKDAFNKLFEDLYLNNFWCYQSDNPNDAYGYLKNLSNIRFARKNQIVPNIELIPFNETKKAKSFEFDHPQKIRIKDFEFKIPPIEFEILYKELILKGKKDIEDARHLRIFFSDIIKKDKLKEYEPIVRWELDSKK